MTHLKRQHIFAAIAILLFSWIIWTQFFATQEALKASDHYHLDKVMHFLGGFLIVGILVYFKFPKMYAFVFLVFLGVGWEVFEVLFFPNVKHFYETLYIHWLSDTSGDVTLDLLGGLFYIFYEKRFSFDVKLGKEQAFSSE